jgi:hypothetical protein
MIDETLRIAAFTKERQRLQLAADRFKQQVRLRGRVPPPLLESVI